MTRHVLALCLIGAACGDDDGTTIDGPPGPDSSDTTDAPPGTPDGSTEADAVPGETIQCGMVVCQVAAQHCCVDTTGGMPTYNCADIGTGCPGTDIACDGPEDCGGQVAAAASRA